MKKNHFPVTTVGELMVLEGLVVAILAIAMTKIGLGDFEELGVANLVIMTIITLSQHWSERIRFTLLCYRIMLFGILYVLKERLFPDSTVWIMIHNIHFGVIFGGFGAAFLIMYLVTLPKGLFTRLDDSNDN